MLNSLFFVKNKNKIIFFKNYEISQKRLPLLFINGFSLFFFWLNVSLLFRFLQFIVATNSLIAI